MTEKFAISDTSQENEPKNIIAKRAEELSKKFQEMSPRYNEGDPEKLRNYVFENAQDLKTMKEIENFFENETENIPSFEPGTDPYNQEVAIKIFPNNIIFVRLHGYNEEYKLDGTYYTVTKEKAVELLKEGIDEQNDKKNRTVERIENQIQIAKGMLDSLK